MNSDIAQRAQDDGGEAILWLVLIFGGLWLAAKAYENYEKKRTAAARKKARDAAGAQVGHWQLATKQAEQRPPRHPGPARPPAGGSPREFLFDPDRARCAISEVVHGLTRCVADEARAYADFLRPSAERLCQPGVYREEEEDWGRFNTWWGPEQQGSRPTREVVDRVDDMFLWASARRNLFSGVHPDAEILLTRMKPLTARFRESRRTRYGRADDGAGIAVLPKGEWEKLLADVHTALTTIADTLRDLPQPELLPRVHRPEEARLRAHKSAEEVEEDLQKFIEHAMTLQETALTGTWPEQFDRTWQLDGGILDGFLTDGIRRRFEKGTAGFAAVARWTTTGITAESRARIYLAYVTIARSYLTEVHDNMGEYRRDSGSHSGPRIKIEGNMIHSNVIIDSTVGDIKTVLAPVADRGDGSLAEAITALTDAVREDSALTESEREELLYHVKDIAEAAAEPGEKHQRSRAKLALDAVSNAAKGAGLLAQTVATWQEVLRSMF